MIRFAAALLAMLATGCASTAAAPAEDRPVFVVMTSGGMVPAVLAAMRSPSLALYGDGRVLTAIPAPALDLVPARYRLSRVDPAGVREFVGSARSGGLFDGADFGTPRVTDLATTTVLAGLAGTQVTEVRVYALDERFDTAVSPAQRDNRSRLRALIAGAGALSGGATGAAWLPDRVAVVEPLPGRNEETADVAWPGPPPSDFLAPGASRRFAACGELTGIAARTAYEAALANPGARWLVEGTARVLAVNPLPVEGC